MELPTPAARYVGVGDRELLAGLRCSTGAWFQDDVETFIQARLGDYHDWRRPHTDYAIVGLELADHGLVAVGSYEAEFVRDSGDLVTSTYLECAAVRTDFQGAVLAEVEPLDDDGPTGDTGPLSARGAAVGHLRAPARAGRARGRRARERP